MENRKLKLKKTTAVHKYAFQNVLRFKSLTHVFVNETQQDIEVRQLGYSEAESIYEVKMKNRKQSYNEGMEALAPVLFEKVYPVFVIKISETGEITDFLNYEDVAYNWSKHKKEITNMFEKNWLTINAIKGIEQLMFDYDEFKNTFSRNLEIKMLFPALFKITNIENDKFIKEDICDELPANIEIPLNIAYKISDGEQNNQVFRFEGTLDYEKFETKKEGELKSEKRKLIELVRTLKNSNIAKFQPLIKQTGFFSFDGNSCINKALEAIKFKIPDFIYQDRITSITLQN